MTVIPDLPAKCQAHGAIPDTSDPSLLFGDLLDVYCPSTKTLVSVGWYPEEDPNGSYFVAAYRESQQLRSLEAKTLDRAVALTEDWCREFQPTAEMRQRAM